MLLERQIEKLKRQVKDQESGYPLMFSALGDPGRFAIFKLLTEHKDLCVTDISRILNVSVPAASHQLKILETAGLVLRERMGQMICYCIKKDDPTVRALLKMFK